MNVLSTRADRPRGRPARAAGRTTGSARAPRAADAREQPLLLAPAPDVVLGLAQQRGDVVVVDRIDAAAALAPGRHEGVVAKHAELVGDGRLPHPEGLDELRDVVG